MHIWSIEFTSKDKTQYPEVTLEGGITWGADEEAIKSAYGEPSASERNDDEKYTNLTYTDNAGKLFILISTTTADSENHNGFLWLILTF